MRLILRFCVSLLLAAGSFAADAANIRGMVGGNVSVAGKQTIVGRSSVSILLMSGYPDKLAQVGSTLTDQSGFYYFYNLAPGHYMLVIANHYYRAIDVESRAVAEPQDIGPIIVQ